MKFKKGNDWNGCTHAEITISEEEMLDYDYQKLRNIFNNLALDYNPLMFLFERGGFRIIADKSSCPGTPLRIVIVFEFTHNGITKFFADEISFQDGLAKFNPHHCFEKISFAVRMFVRSFYEDKRSA